MTKFERMVKSLPSFYRAEVSIMLGGLLKSWGISDDEVEVQIQNTKDQLFVKTAEGRYLNRLGTNVGVDRPSELGMDDPTFQNLVPVMSFFPKQVRGTIISLLDVFWGPGFTRPNLNSGNPESYDFGPSSTISGTANFRKDRKLILGTGTQFTVELSVGDYIKPLGVSGIQYAKVSNIISDTELELASSWEQDVAIGVSVEKGPVRTLEYQTDQNEQSTIRFIPNAFEDITDIPVQELVDFINDNNEHNVSITASLFADPLAGNKLNLRTNTSGLQGSIKIIGGDANSLTRLNFDLDLHVERKAEVFEINPNELVVKIPSSVPILRRTLKGSSHPRDTKAVIYSDNEVFDFSSIGASSTLTLTIDGTPTVFNFTHASDFADSTAVTSREVVIAINKQAIGIEAFSGEVDAFRRLGLRTTVGSAEYQITGGTANSVLNFTTDLQTDPDLIDTDFPSSYIFDPIGQLFTVTGIKTELTTQIISGSINPTLAVVDASSFPNKPGQLIVSFGGSKQEGPISYNSRPNNSTILMDASYIFSNEHIVGSSVNYIISESTIPRVTGDDYATYITGTEEAREAAQNLIRKLLAAGVVIRFIIEFPEFLFTCSVRGSGPENIDDPDYRGSRTNDPPLVF
jgi:hypothetical protein